MRKTGLTTRFLALLLCFLMVFTSVPMAVFAAESDTQTAADTSATETPAEAEPSTQTLEEVPQEEEETPEEQEAVVLSDPAPAADAGVTVTISNAGTLAAVNTAVTVKDLNSDGVLTYDEAMQAFHDVACPGGYEATQSGYGAFVTKLWGIANGGSYLFCKNGVPLSYAVDSTESTVAAGDQLYAAVLKNTSSYDDWYSSFDKRTASVETGEDVTLTLTGFLGMGYTSEQLTPTAVSGVQIGTWANGVFTALEGKTTDTDGKVTLSFDTAGNYVVSAQGNTAAGKPIMAPVCVVTVTAKEVPEEPAKHYLSGLEVGKSATALTPMTLESSVWDYTAEVASSSSAMVLKATLSADAPEGATITAKYMNTLSNKESTITLTSGTGKYLSTVVKLGMQGATITLQVGVEGDHQTYTLKLDRPVELTVKSVADSNGTVLTMYENRYMVPEDVETVKLTVNSNGADLTINGQTATSGEAFELTPVWDADNTCTVTLNGTYEGKSGEQKIVLKKLLTTDEFSGSCGENITWKLANGTLTLTGSGDMTSYAQKDVPWYAFMGRIKTAIIGEGITSISKYAFRSATALSNVTLPTTLEVVGEEAFSSCMALKQIKLPDGLKELDTRAFQKSGLTEISIPASVDKIYYYVFNGCADLKSATVTSAINENMFSDCGQLETLTFADNGVTRMHASTIANCASLKKLKLPEGMTEVYGSNGYNQVNYVQELSIPNSMTSIGNGIFGSNLTSIVIKDNNPNFAKDGKILYTKDYKEMVLCEQDISGEITFHAGLESISASAFASNTKITKVTLPGSTKTIGKDAFNGCSNLETVVLNEGLESFGENAFYNCSKLANITLPSSLTSLGKMAFYACNSLKTIEIPEKITALPNLLFSNAKGLETIILSAGLTRMEERTFFNCEKTLKTIYFRGTGTAWNAVANRPADGVYEVVCNYGRTDIATVVTQPEDRFFVIGANADKALSVTVTKPEGVAVSFAWYVNDTKSGVGGTLLTEGVSVSADGLSSFCTPNTDEAGVRYYYCIVTSTLKDDALETNSKIATVEVSAKLWEGEGTEKNPFLLATTEDMQKLYTYVSEGSTTDGKYFAVTDTITLPDDWVPIGTAENRFAGTIDGRISDTENATILVPEGGKPLLGYVLNATIKNLNIKGARIDGYGLINNFVGNDITSETVIDNVTIKSGTNILKSGLLGTYTTTSPYAGCSASYQATIRNCTVESNVVIGYNKDQSKIGSLAGRFVGSVENCVSYATVYGVDYVGGLVGNRDNAMGSCTVSNSQFHGTVEGSGQFAGGIIGGGYEDGTLASAPSGLHPTIKSCGVDGTVKGNEAVGGITGGDRLVAQSWNAYDVIGNTFTGNISGNKYVGGIIGYYRSLNKMDNIAGNAYSGADRGIGYVAYLDTSYGSPAVFEDTLVINTGKGTAQCPSVQWHTWVSNYNRTDDPLGVDADKLCKKLSNDQPITPVVYELVVSGTYKTEYTVGDELDLTGIGLTAKWTAGKADTALSLSDVTVSGYDRNKTGIQTVTLTYGTIRAEITVTVVPKSTGITVNVSILGDSKHSGDVGPHGLAMGGLTAWVSETDFPADTTETIWSILQRVFQKHGMTVQADSNNAYGTVYIRAINGLGELDNGGNSGWMFVVNGSHPNVGVGATYAKQGDTIVVHYTDDYSYEEDGANYAKPSDDSGAMEVDRLIAEIGTVTLSDACKGKITAARKAYKNLSAADKAKVTGLSVLEAAEKKYDELKRTEDQKQASAVMEAIGKIDRNVTQDSEQGIRNARNAYDALTEDQKLLVTNYKTLTAAETALAKLKATDADRKKAKKVSDTIDELGKITLASEQRIEEARAAYDALTELQKKLVENYEVLTNAEEQLKELKARDEIRQLHSMIGARLEELGTPAVGSVGGEWMVLGMARSGLSVPDGYYENVLAYVRENIDENGRLHSAKSTENSRLILALTAMGKDVTDVGGYDLLQGLSSMEFIMKQGINGPIWALIALDCGNYSAPGGIDGTEDRLSAQTASTSRVTFGGTEYTVDFLSARSDDVTAAQSDVTREKLLEVILDAQLADGGWALSGEDADADMTGMALQALAPYYQTNARVTDAVDAALATLSDMQNDDGGFSAFSSGGRVATCESVSQVIVALTALGIDPRTDERFIKNGCSAIDALMSYQVDGGFKHTLDGEVDGMATEQGYYALTAYERFADGKTGLYDMTDVIDMGGDVVRAVPEDTEQESLPVSANDRDDVMDVEETDTPWLVVILVLTAGVAVAAFLIIRREVKKRRK